MNLPKNVNLSAVGAEAKITGKSKFRKSFKIHIESIINNNQKRAIKMWLKSNYSAIIRMYLKKYKQIKIHIDASGNIVKIEKEKNNTWVVGSQLKSDLKKLPNNLVNNHKLVITLKQ